MINRVVVYNWQSLQHVELSLGRFSVIVGPSSSGKSALLRALRAVVSNVRGAAVITRGAKAAAVTVHTDAGAVTLERSPTASRYRILSPDGQERLYTKLGVLGVPGDVTRALAMAPAAPGETSLHFAGQFDRPYLLDESGAAVARVLGTLTNVTTIFAAVAEANRRRRRYAAELHARQAERDRLREQAGQFRDLPTQLAGLSQAEQLHEQVTALGARRDALAGLLRQAADAQAALAAVVVPDVPASGELERLRERHRNLAGLLSTWAAATQVQTTAAPQRFAALEAGLQEQLHTVLLSAGTCPTCNQPITQSNPAALSQV